MAVVVVMNKIYTETEISDQVTENERLILGSFGHLQYGLVFNPVWSCIKSVKLYTAHLSFYALSDGWEDYTATGYKSHFFSADTSICMGDDTVTCYFSDLLTAADFDPLKSVQLDLFA
jgi:hypothetical protein